MVSREEIVPWERVAADALPRSSTSAHTVRVRVVLPRPPTSKPPVEVRVAAAAWSTLLHPPPPPPASPQIVLRQLQPTQPTHPPAKMEQQKEEIKQELRQTLEAEIKAQLREEFKESFKEEIKNEMREEFRQDFAELLSQAKLQSKDLISLHERLLKVETMKAEKGLRLQSLETKSKHMRFELDGLASRFTTYEETVGVPAPKPKRQRS